MARKNSSNNSSNNKTRKGKEKELPTNVRERNGKYHYRYSIKNPVTGKRIQKESVGFATPREAEKEGRRIEAEKLLGTYVDKLKDTVTDWCDHWLNWYASTGQVKEITINQRANMLELLKSQIGGLNLQEVTEEIYQEVLHKLSKVHSFNTLSSMHGVAKRVFLRAVQKGKIKSNPAEHAFIPKKTKTFEEREASKKLPRFLEKHELIKFLAAVEGSQFRRVFALLAYTGMRMGELSSLFVDDFSDEVYLNISKTRYAPASIAKYQLTSPKNESSDRIIHLSKRAISVIKEQIVWRKAFAFSKGNDFYKERQFLFVCEKARAGYPLYPTLVSKQMKRALSRANLPKNLTPHSLRHTYTSLMAEAGADLDTIQAQLGHKKGSDVTRAIYLHVTKAREKRDVDRLDALLDACE
ncbi:tyrosine-type recombinase/integrase [Paenibacillus tyrfis]|uniref:tyrosine-type recombinase/integrase n=1 Tax=Paenibacillus tyrfis TaxID=1501230 RepID=UPI000B589D23|nr:tyrosine-type recombinase/integrase [Paenibacillus tyrfis]